jgi:hypothetical protein
MKPLVHLLVPALFACVATAATLGCSSSSGASSTSGCSALAACCSALGGDEQQACNEVIMESGVTDSECNQELAMLSSIGVCANAAAANSGTAPAEGSAGGGGTTCSGAGASFTLSPCGMLKECCTELTVSESPETCLTVAGDGTPEACASSLATYQAGGSCTDVTTCEPNVVVLGPIECHEDGESGMCTFAETSGTACPSTLSPGPCPSEGLVGCCVLSGTGSTTSGFCIYDEAQAAPTIQACNAEGDSWSGTAP